MKSTISTLALTGFLFAVPPSVQAKEGPSKVAQAKAVAKSFRSPQKEGSKATCPVTGEEFTIAKNTAHAEYKGKHVYFCCPGCKPAFDKNPEKYLK